MIHKDRALLAQMASANQNMGEVLLSMLAREDGGELNTDDLRSVGRALTQLGADMVRRADESIRPIAEGAG